MILKSFRTKKKYHENQLNWNRQIIEEQTCSELKLPHKINIFLARVNATFSRCRMAKKPIPLVRAIDIMTMSRSCPWHESMVLTLTYGYVELQIIRLSIATK